MLQDILETSLSSLNENTTDDISNTDNIIGSLIKEKYNDSLAYQICDVQPLTTPYGKLFVSKIEDDTSDFKIVQKEVQVGLDIIQTSFTQEVLQDMNSMFSQSAKTSAARVVSGESHKAENKKIINFLLTESTTLEAVTVQDPENLESVLLQVSKKVSESVIEMNRENYKTLDSFCILGKDFAAAVLGSFDFMTEGNEKSLFVGRVGRTDYYVNPFSNTASQFTDDFDYAYESEDSTIPDYCFVGLKSKTHGQSSLTFCPYKYEAEYVTDPDTLELILFIRNRYGLVTSPFHEPLKNRSMLHKFALVKGS